MKISAPTHALKPLSVNGLLCLMGRPKDFFSGAFDLKHIPSLLIIAYICGLERANAAFSLTNISPEQISAAYNGVAPQWSQVWVDLLPMAGFMGLLKWLVGGFWYNLRATWCGYKDGDTLLVRSTFIFTEAIVAIPLVLHLIMQTLIYSDPMAASLDTAPGALQVVSIALGTLSIIISYYAIQTRLGLSGNQTRLWFLVLPLSLQLLAITGLTLIN